MQSRAQIDPEPDGLTMVYEHTTQSRHFVIEWGRPETWSEGQATKWVGSCHGVVLARGATPAAVLGALLSGACSPLLDGTNPSTMRLPASIDEWRTSRG